MEIKINVPNYDRNFGLSDSWTDGYEIKVTNENGEISIFANEEGLRSLATHLLALTGDDVPSGYHLHFSEDYGLEEGSMDLVIGKK
jgi:hypothetical protein